jgi:hypothetical protein
MYSLHTCSKLDLPHKVIECYWIRFHLLITIRMAGHNLFSIYDNYSHLPVCFYCLQLQKGISEHGHAPLNNQFLNVCGNFLSLKLAKGPTGICSSTFFLISGVACRKCKSVFTIKKHEINALTSASAGYSLCIFNSSFTLSAFNFFAT